MNKALVEMAIAGTAYVEPAVTSVALIGRFNSVPANMRSIS